MRKSSSRAWAILGAARPHSASRSTWPRDSAKAGFGREGEVLDLVARWLRRAPPLVLGSLLAGTVAAVAILLAVQGLRILGIAAVSIGALALLKLALR